MSDTLNTGRVIVGTINPFTTPVQVLSANPNRTSAVINSTHYLLVAADPTTVVGSPFLLSPYVPIQLGDYQGSIWVAIPGPAFSTVPIVGSNISAHPAWCFFTEILNLGSEDVLVSLPAITGVGAGLDFFLPEPASTFSIQTVSTGGPTYNVILQASQDGVNWFQIGRTSQSFYTGSGGSGPQTISADGLNTLVDGPVQHIRLNCTRFSGGTNPSLTASVIVS